MKTVSAITSIVCCFIFSVCHQNKVAAAADQSQSETTPSVTNAGTQDKGTGIFLWPISGKSNGDGVVGRPQTYIGDELNLERLFISGSDGDIILCPESGRVMDFKVVDNSSLKSFGRKGKSIDEIIAGVDGMTDLDRQYLSGYISIMTDSGIYVAITGFVGKRVFRVGQRIERGDTLGTLGYSYMGFNDPTLNIAVGVTDRKWIIRTSDPMLPFGLTTTFVDLYSLNREDPLPIDKIKEDLTVLETAVSEVYPSLDELMSPESFHSYMDSVRMSVTRPMRSFEVRLLLQSVLTAIHDSNLRLMPDRLRYLAPYNSSAKMSESVPEMSCQRKHDSPIRDYKREAAVSRWRRLNSLTDYREPISVKTLNDSTTYLSLKTFDLLDNHLGRLRLFLDTCRTSNMIIDLRNNSGGSPEMMVRVLSFVTDKPLDRQKGGILQVRKTGNFRSFRYCLNHTSDEVLFPEYEPNDGLFTRASPFDRISPDSTTCYRGKLYLLTNGQTLSSATLFSSILIRNRRAVTVGRETGSAYHFLTMLEYADIRLPNSLNDIRIPMIKVTFDTTIRSRTPTASGLMPDYETPLTDYEIQMGSDGKTDVMLEYALSLIKAGEYLPSPDPFYQADKPARQKSRSKVILIVVVTCISFLVWKKIQTARHKNRHIL